MPREASIEELLTDATSWSVNSDGAILCYTDHFAYVEDHFIVPDVDLEAAHPQLPSVIRAIVDWKTQHGQTPSASKVLVHQTLCYMRTGSIKIKSFFDVRVWDFTTITELSIASHRPDLVWFKGDHIFLANASPAFGGMPIAVEYDFKATPVKRERLDAAYPGWASRWEAVDALDLSITEQASYIFSSQPDLSRVSSLSGLSFD